jgi:hypothetical protein
MDGREEFLLAFDVAHAIRGIREDEGCLLVSHEPSDIFRLCRITQKKPVLAQLP